MTKSEKLNFLILFLLGGISSFSLPPYNFFFINFLSFTFLFLFLVEAKNSNKSKLIFFLYGWFFGFGYFICSLYWISISLTFDNNFKFLIPISIIDFYHSDVVRHPLVSKIVKAYSDINND